MTEGQRAHVRRKLSQIFQPASPDRLWQAERFLKREFTLIWLFLMSINSIHEMRRLKKTSRLWHLGLEQTLPRSTSKASGNTGLLLSHKISSKNKKCTSQEILTKVRYPFHQTLLPCGLWVTSHRKGMVVEFRIIEFPCNPTAPLWSSINSIFLINRGRQQALHSPGNAGSQGCLCLDPSWLYLQGPVTPPTLISNQHQAPHSALHNPGDPFCLLVNRYVQISVTHCVLNV